MNRFPEASEAGFGVAVRAFFAIVAVALLVFGVLSVFQTDNDIASASLIAIGAALVYVAAADQRIVRFSKTGIELERFHMVAEKLVEDAIAPETPPEVKTWLTTRFEGLAEDAPQSALAEVRTQAKRQAVTKRELLQQLCEELGIDPLPLGPGSTLPAEVFRVAAGRVGVPATGSMPHIAESIVGAAAQEWASSDWSAGSTVTAGGLQKVLQAVRLHKTSG